MKTKIRQEILMVVIMKMSSVMLTNVSEMPVASMRAIYLSKIT
jgi:hypothetical protein